MAKLDGQQIGARITVAGVICRKVGRSTFLIDRHRQQVGRHVLTFALKTSSGPSLRLRLRGAEIRTRRTPLSGAPVSFRGTFLAIVFAEFMALATPLTAGSAPASNPAVQSGSYSDNMLIGYDPATHDVSGYYEAYTGQKQFSCVFALNGKLRGPSTSIQTYFPDARSDVIRGVFSKSTRSRFTILLSAEHDGCWNVQHFSDKKQPVQFELRVAYPWISVAVIKSARAYLFDAIDSRPRRAFLVEGDGVGVRAVRRQWLQVDFIGGRKPISGWIRKSDVYPSLEQP